MEVGPGLCFWSNRSTELNGAPVLTLSQSMNSGSEMRPCPINGFAGIVLELESDTELDSPPKDHWEQGVIKLTSADLIDSASTSPIPLNPAESQAHQTAGQVTHQVDCRSKSISSLPVTSKATAVTSIQASTSSFTLTDVHRTKPAYVSASCGEPKDKTVITTASIEPREAAGVSESRNWVIFPNQNSVKCSLCERTFVNCRSRNIHMNKTHSVKSVSAPRNQVRKTQTTITKAVVVTTAASTTNNTTTVSDTLLPGDITVKSVNNESPLEISTDLPHSNSGTPNIHSCALETAAGLVEPQLAHENQSIQCDTATSKGCPRYTVSSPPPGSPSLKIRLVSVKHSKGRKTRSNSNGSASHSISSVSSVDGNSDHTPERVSGNCLAVTTHSFTESEATEPALQALDSGISCDLRLTTGCHSTQSDLGGLEASASETEQQPNQFTTFTDKSTTSNSPLHPTPISLPDTEARKGASKVTGISSSVSYRSSPTPSIPSLSPATYSEQSKTVRLDATQPGTTSSTNSTPMPVLDTTLRTRDGLYKCRACRRVFSNRFSLTGHYKSHYNATQKPHVCEDCNQRYTSASNLQYHRARTCSVLKRKAAEANRSQNCDMIPKTSAKSNINKPRSRRAASSRSSRGTRRPNIVAESKPDDTTANIESHASVSLIDQHPKPIDDEDFAPPKPKQLKQTVVSVEHSHSPTPSCSTQGNTSEIKPDLEPVSNDQSSGSFSEAHTKLQRLIEEICNSQEVRDKILSLTSAAILSAIKPLASAGSETLLSELLNLPRHTNEGSVQSQPSTAFRRVSASTGYDGLHSLAPINNTAPANGVMSHEVEKHAQRHSWSDSQTDSVMVTEQANRKNDIRAMHSPPPSGSQSDQNKFTNTTQGDHGGALPTKDSSKRPLLNPSIPRANSRSRVNSTASQPICSRTSATLFLCENCDRHYSSQSAYRTHFKKFHQASRTGSGTQSKLDATGLDTAQTH